MQIPPDAPLELPGASNEIYVEERGEQSSMPQWPGVPTRRLRGKTAVPAIRSMVNIEGEAWGLNTNDPTKDAVLTGIPNQAFQIPEYLKSHLEGDEIGSSGESSWTLGTDSEQTTASPTASTPTLQFDAEEFGGGSGRRRLTTGTVAQARWPQLLQGLLQFGPAMPMWLTTSGTR